MKQQVREYAVNNLSWFKNSEQLSDLISDCKSLEIHEESKKTANQIDQYKLPYFERFKVIYKKEMALYGPFFIVVILLRYIYPAPPRKLLKSKPEASTVIVLTV